MNKDFAEFDRFGTQSDPDDHDGTFSTGFDWDAIERGMGERNSRKSDIEDAEQDGARMGISAFIEICAEDASSVRQITRRTHVIGLRALCLAAIIHPGQVTEQSAKEVAKFTGMDVKYIFRMMHKMKSRLEMKSRPAQL